MHSAATYRPSTLSTFSRSQVASLVATTVDYGSLFLLTELCGVWYVTATAWGAFFGAVANFVINRHWSFQAAHKRWYSQALRYSIVSAGSLALNTGGVYLVTEYGKLHYAFSVVLVSIGVGIFFNYPLHRHFVYRH
jgi:putative flippase GtrA